MKVFSFDAETNGLYGEAFALAAVVTDEKGDEVANFVARCPIAGPVDDWVEANVLPHLKDLSESHESYREMLESFFDFYKTHKSEATILAHIAIPVEAKVVRDVVELDLENRQWDGPFPLIDVASVLAAKGFDPSSVDAYNKGNGITVPFSGATHHPLYDSWAAERCYRHLMTETV